MKRWQTSLFAVFVATACAAGTWARAETCKLELKRLDAAKPGIVGGMPADQLYRTTMPQHLFIQMMGKGRPQKDENSAAFARAIKKEPAKYQSEQPLRGAIKLGGQDYGFALDTKDAKDAGYTRLYFDINHNGDLTDDKPIDAESNNGVIALGLINDGGWAQFPRVDVTLTIDGKKLDYAFTMGCYSQTSGDFRYASVQLNAAAYREGHVTLNGKPRRLVLLDFNSNGRFDDLWTVRDNGGPEGELVITQGDTLLVDPDAKNEEAFNYWEMTASRSRQQMSKLVSIDGRFYDIRVTPAGDELTLTPSKAEIGYLTNPNDGYRAMVYSDQGVLALSGDKGAKTPVPAGAWRLVSYTIDITKQVEAKKKEEAAKKDADKNKEDKKDEKSPEGSLLKALFDALVGSGPVISQGPRITRVAANATSASKPVKVEQGRATPLPFGPPYKPVVKAFALNGGNAHLSLSLIGSAGETCNDMMVDGGRPSAPEFTIKSPKGDVVEHGSFKYG